MDELMNGWVDVRADGWVGKCQIWAGFPLRGNMLICNCFVCDRHVTGFGLTVRYLCYVMLC